MFKSKYGSTLSIILIVLIIVILIIAVIFGIKTYKKYEEKKLKRSVYEELVEDDFNSSAKNEKNENTTIDENISIGLVETNTTSNNNTSGGGGTTPNRRKTVYYKDYPVVGYIKISKTNVDYPILLDMSPGALDTAVCVMYPTNPKLNQPGNVVIIGHNYRNGKFFANNKKLENGDKIEITDLSGQKLIYTVYSVYQTTETDTEYITRDRGGKIEISLSTCTDDANARTIVLARVEE